MYFLFLLFSYLDEFLDKVARSHVKKQSFENSSLQLARYILFSTALTECRSRDIDRERRTRLELFLYAVAIVASSLLSNPLPTPAIIGSTRPGSEKKKNKSLENGCLKKKTSGNKVVLVLLSEKWIFLRKIFNYLFETLHHCFYHHPPFYRTDEI